MIKAEKIRYRVDSFTLNASLEVLDNEYFVLLGMTGSGKTLFLENLSGLRAPAGGRIFIGGREVTGLEPRERGVGYVPQDGALFEHLSVADNIGFALRVKGEPHDLRLRLTEELASGLGIRALLNRGIRGLSGGEKQRVALGRALASRPACLLLDEPVSALDEYTREGVCGELKRLQREFRLSVIHVCHSFEEARLVGDRIGIMHEGRIVQTGTADGLMNAPAEEVVANILRAENLLSGEAFTENNRGMIRLNGRVLYAPFARGSVRFFIRSWQVQPLGRFQDPTGLNVLAGEVTDVLINGFSAKILVRSEIPLVFYLSRHDLEDDGIKKGARISVAFPPDAIHIFRETVI